MPIPFVGFWGRFKRQRHFGSQYDGEKSPNEFAKWRFFNPDPNEFVWNSYPLLVAYCTTLYNSSSLARAAVEKVLSYVIGNGLLFRSHVPEKILGVTKDYARDWSREFTELIHIEKQAANYYRYQQELAREAKIAGDSLLYILYRNNGDIDFATSSGINIDFQRGEMGLRVNDTSQTTGVYIAERKNVLNFVSTNGDLQLLHFKFGGRPRQLRGLSTFYSEVSRCKNLDRGWDAVLARFLHEAIILGQYASENPLTAKANMGSLAERAMPSGVKPLEFEQKTYDINPGAFFFGTPQDRIEFVRPETPNNNFGLFNEWTWFNFAASVGYPPGFLRGYYPESYSAHKGEINDAWRKILQERAIFSTEVEQKVNEVLLKKLVREKKIKPLGDLNDRRVLIAHLQGSYVGVTPGHINPVQEVTALKLGVEQGFMTRSDAAQQYGNNFSDMIDEWKREEEEYFEVLELKMPKKDEGDDDDKEDIDDDDNKDIDDDDDDDDDNKGLN